MPQNPNSNSGPAGRHSNLALFVTTLGALITLLAVVGVLISLLGQDWSGVWFCIGLIVFSMWGSLTALRLSHDPDGSYGGVLGLGGFIAGSVLALFPGPSDILHGNAADSTPWQTFCWLIGVASFVATVEFARRKT